MIHGSVPGTSAGMFTIPISDPLPAAIHTYGDMVLHIAVNFSLLTVRTEVAATTSRREEVGVGALHY